MRELIYLSERKLGQFQERKKFRWWPRVSGWSAKAPIGLGEVQVTLAGQAAPERPSLDRVLRHLDGLRPRPTPYFEGAAEPGRWVRFDTRLNYRIVQPVRRMARELPVLLFWEPRPLWDQSRPRLLLHGAPEHLTGVVPIDRDDVYEYRLSPSSPSEIADFLYGRGGGPVRGGRSLAMGRLLEDLDKDMPPQMAGRMAGYARVSFDAEAEVHSETMTVLLASPLYVEIAA
jgi:hypothetical protein